MKGGMYDCLQSTLLMGKCCGFMPLTGFGSRENLRFSWKCAYNFILLINLLIQFFMLLLQVYGLVRSGFEWLRINTILYFGFNFTMFLLMLSFSRRYKNFMSSIESVEKLLPRIHTPRSTIRLFNIFVGAMLVIGLFDHAFFRFYSFYLTSKCSKSHEPYWELHFKIVYHWYYEVYSFSYIVPSIFEVIKLQISVLRVYGDVLIICFCIYLKNRFKDFNRLIINNKSMFNESFKPSWSELQVHYTRISKLVALVDDNINSIVFLSFTSNLYFICLSAYFILNQLTGTYITESSDCGEQLRKDFIPVMCRVFTTGFLVIRTCLVSHSAAEVNVVSRLPLKVLHTVPSASYDANMRRLMSQVYYSKNAISGLNFYHITRGILLAMVAKMLTYEIVLIQV